MTIENKLASHRITLNNGLTIPTVGLGVFKATPEDCYNIVVEALKAGYRHIDSAAIYKNESDVGRAVRESGIPRTEIFVTTKMFFHDSEVYKNDAEIASATREKFEHSFKCLDLEYIDLWLIHAPFVKIRLAAWKAMEEIVRSGRVKSIGISNFSVKHIDELLAVCTIKPVVNQIELHPFFQQREITAHCAKHNIIPEAYSPIVKALKFDDPTLIKVSKLVGKTPAQVLIRWGVQKGYISLPKTVTASRLPENADVFWEMPAAAMKMLDGLNEDLCTGWDPTKWE